MTMTALPTSELDGAIVQVFDAFVEQRRTLSSVVRSKAGVTVRIARRAQGVAACQEKLNQFRASKTDFDMAGTPDAAGQAALIERLGGAFLLAEAQDEGGTNQMQLENKFAPTRQIVPPVQVAAINPWRHAVFFGARQMYRGSAMIRRVSALRGARHAD